VRSSASFTLPANLEGVFLTDQALNATGNDSNNLFQGNSRDGTIRAGSARLNTQRPEIGGLAAV
jgi:hypothetical protein